MSEMMDGTLTNLNLFDKSVNRGSEEVKEEEDEEEEEEGKEEESFLDLSTTFHGGKA
jgi:hypothetical protein